MFDVKAVVSDPCQVCRIMVLIVVWASLTQPLGLEDTDFFHLRVQFGAVPPMVDFAIIMMFAGAAWVVCERVIAEKLLGGCGKAGGAQVQA